MLQAVDGLAPGLQQALIDLFGSLEVQLLVEQGFGTAAASFITCGANPLEVKTRAPEGTPAHGAP